MIAAIYARKSTEENTALIDGAASDLEDFNEEILTPGHWPSWI